MNLAVDQVDARAQAARVLAQVLDGRALDAVLPGADAQLPDARDRGLLRAICFATLRGIHRYQALLAALLSRGGSRLDPLVHAALLAGIAQLDQQITPAYAAVSSTVGAVRALGRPRLAPLANAVLRRYQREASALHAALGDDPVQQWQHPRWLIDRLAHDWPHDWQRILAANNAQAPMILRVNRRRHTRAEYLQQLRDVGIDAQAHEHLPDAVLLAAATDVHALPGFDRGSVSVQDGAAQLAVELLDAQPGHRVLDACAAPGGKTAHLLEHEPSLQLLALDAAPERAARVGQTLERLGLDASVRCTDATTPLIWWDRLPFDRILIDAPCSGTGVIRRHPDIRLLRRASDIAGMLALQDRLLDSLWPLLAPGGRLVYATCSVLADENARRIEDFLARTPGAHVLDVVPEWFGARSGAGRQHFPGDHALDGFFYAVLAPR
jgi:16S rRNA (cytosine967-C5)-methyltransferase